MKSKAQGYLMAAVFSLLSFPILAHADKNKDWWRNDHDNGNHYGRTWNYGSSDHKGYNWGNYRSPYSSYTYRYPEHSRPPYYSSNYPNFHESEDLIRNGIWSGRLTDREVSDIRDDQRDIAREYREYWSDGRLTDSERRDLQNDIASYHEGIRHNLNDGERR